MGMGVSDALVILIYSRLIMSKEMADVFQGKVGNLPSSAPRA